MKKSILILKSQGRWESILNEYFSEVDFDLLLDADAGAFSKADFVMAEPALLTLPVLQKIRSAKSLNPALRIFALGSALSGQENIFDAELPEACGLFEFTKKVSEKLPLAEKVRLLVADDDSEILAMVGDYFEDRRGPSFEVRRAGNGREALELIQKRKPDVMILDVKMPVMKGSELYIKLQKENIKIPTIVFFDAISAGDLDLVKKEGKPVIVEKGYRESSMTYLMALVKKLVYFSDC